MRAAKRRLLLTLTAAALAFAGLSASPPVRNVRAEEAQSHAECVLEVSSRRFLHEKDADLPLPIASTTKILTAIILLEDCALTEEVTIPREAELAGGSSVYLRKGEVYTVEDLLYGLLLRSGNDCAVSLAIHHSGSIAKFATVMNVRATLLGAEHSNFCNPHGLPQKGHLSTARDLALIAAHAMENETFRAIVSAKTYPARGWRNKNKLLFGTLEGACGIKTGYTKEAGRCLVGAAERDGITLVSVVLNCPRMYERSEALLDDAFSQYEIASFQ